MKRLTMLLVAVTASLWALNTSLFVDTADHQTRLIAHRGVHQIYVGTDRSATSCHAAPVAPITHSFIENTLPSMQEAFRLGADVVEIDVHLTPDNAFAVFHDWTLDCRTNGTGITHKQPMSTLKTLDLGYRIDDGSGRFPLRGTAVGTMPTVQDVVHARMEGTFLINFKSDFAKDGIAFAEHYDTLQMAPQIFGVYGGSKPVRSFLAAQPGTRGFDRGAVKGCLLRYAALGWSGYVPELCRDTLMLVPQSHGWLLWGWPHKLTQRFAAHGTDIILVGPYDGSGFTSGIDDAAAFDAVPAAFDGYIWTNRIEVLGPLLEDRQTQTN